MKILVTGGTVFASRFTAEYFVKGNSEMSKLMPNVKPLEDGLKQSYEWFKDNRGEVLRKKLFEFIESELRG